MRNLTQDELKVLAHVVIDPESWWNHCQTAPNIADPELALAAKIAKHYVKYWKDLKAKGDDYETRAEREDQP